MDKYTNIEAELVKEYMPSIEMSKGTTMYDIYEFTIKLSASMTVTALKKYHESEGSE